MTYQKLSKTAAAVLMASGIVLATGCASTSQMDELRVMAGEAKTAASQAQSTANQAKASADKAAADAAAAMRRAEEANSCCQQTNEKIDRMFKKSMHK